MQLKGKHTNTMKNLIIFSLIFVGLLTSCKKDLIPAPKEQPTAAAAPTQTKELKVGAEFKWNTNVTLDITINPSSLGILIIQDEKGTAVYKAMAAAGQPHTANVTVPATLNKLFIYFNGQKEEITNIRVTQFASSLK